VGAFGSLWEPWESLGASGSLWEPLGAFGGLSVNLWEPLGASGSLWEPLCEPLGASGSLCEPLGAFGSLWEPLGAGSHMCVRPLGLGTLQQEFPRCGYHLLRACEGLGPRRFGGCREGFLTVRTDRRVTAAIGQRDLCGES
jgi:hypothetical protein